jgi:capsular exopolysaccharide synthesis family protein
VVTSAGQGEGKTVVASNIALALARGGERVLLMDADMRRPRVHELFERPQEPGLSNLIVSNNLDCEALREPAFPGLWILPAGTIPPDPSELLGSPRFKELITALATRFDWLVMDSPPVGAVTDPCVLANGASGVLFVICAQINTRRSARRALEQLELANARMVGAVLNRMDVEGSDYYVRSYQETFDPRLARSSS